MTEALTRLPRGRHRMTREQVAGSQRFRMLYAMAEAVAAQGYVATSVADVLRGGGVSRETFYQAFSSKQDCFLQALDASADVLLGALDVTGPATGTPLERWEQLLGTYLETLAGRPALARVFMIEVYAAGAEALPRRIAVQQRFVDLAVEILGARSRQDRFACEAVVAAISTLVTLRLAAGDIEGLVALRAPLVAFTAHAVHTLH